MPLRVVSLFLKKAMQLAIYRPQQLWSKVWGINHGRDRQMALPGTQLHQHALPITVPNKRLKENYYE
jgi:hypothetical protein